jgi:hypothetical protein
MSQEFKGECGICGSVGPYASPLLKMCYKCHRLYGGASSPIVEMTGWPGNSTYYRRENKAAIEKWFAHLRKHGFVQKRGKWARPETRQARAKAK